jgi:hypothetical protein
MTLPMKTTLLLLCFLVWGINCSADDFVGTHLTGGGVQLLALPAPKDVSDNDWCFYDGLLGLEIIRVACDGKEVAPVPYQIDLNHIDTRLLKGRVVYYVPNSGFGASSNMKLPSIAFDQVVYNMPLNTKVIEIVYRIRLATGRLSSICRLTSYDSHTHPGGIVYEELAEHLKMNPTGQPTHGEGQRAK